MSENNLYYTERVPRAVAGSADGIDLIRDDLPGGVSCVVPRVLYAKASGVFRLKRFAESESCASADNRSVRLAAVIIAWNVLQYFYPYFDVAHSDWPQAVIAALKSAATDDGPVQFVSSLRRMMAALHDSHARVTMTGMDAVPGPVGWDWVEGRIVLTDLSHATDPTVACGDAIVKLDGRPATDALAAAETEISSATPQWLIGAVRPARHDAQSDPGAAVLSPDC